MSFAPPPLQYSQAALSSRTQLSLRGRRAPPNTPNSDRLDLDAHLLSSSPSSSTRSFIPDSQDGEEGEELEVEHPRPCQHQPPEDQQDDQRSGQSRLCGACKYVNGAITLLQQHQMKVREDATQYLNEARHTLPYLYLDAMQQNSQDNTNENENNSELRAQVRQFRRHKGQFEHWCSTLGLNENEVWDDWVEMTDGNAAEADTEAGTETEVVAETGVRVEGTEHELRGGGGLDEGNDHYAYSGMETVPEVGENDEVDVEALRQRIRNGGLGRCGIRNVKRSNGDACA